MVVNSESHRFNICLAILNAWLKAPSLRLGQFLINAGGNPDQWRHYSNDIIFAKHIIDWADKHSSVDSYVQTFIFRRANTELQKRDVIDQMFFLWDIYYDSTFRSLIHRVHTNSNVPIFYVEDYELLDLVRLWSLPEDLSI
jgi:hypothetical protein